MHNDMYFLNSLFPYFKMLNNINIYLNEISHNNYEKEPYENEEKMYLLISNLIRLFPYKKIIDKDTKKFLSFKLLIDDGILQLKEYIPFLEFEYDKLLNNKKYEDMFITILQIRNKFIHKPHNINFAFSVGGKNTYSMSLYYKDTLLPISTMELTTIVYKLNVLFTKIKDLFEKSVSIEYKEHPYYKSMMNFDFTAFSYDILPKYL